MRKNFQRSCCGLILGYYPGIRPERLRKITKNVSQGSGFQGRDLKPAPPLDEAGVLINPPRRSVINCPQQCFFIKILPFDVNSYSFLSPTLTSVKMNKFSYKYSCSNTSMIL
jgi:hypothetical protein